MTPQVITVNLSASIIYVQCSCADDPTSSKDIDLEPNTNAKVLKLRLLKCRRIITIPYYILY